MLLLKKNMADLPSKPSESLQIQLILILKKSYVTQNAKGYFIAKWVKIFIECLLTRAKENLRMRLSIRVQKCWPLQNVPPLLKQNVVLDVKSSHQMCPTYIFTGRTFCCQEASASDGLAGPHIDSFCLVKLKVTSVDFDGCRFA